MAVLLYNGYFTMAVLDLTANLRTRDLFKDADSLRTELIDSFGLDPQLVEAVMDSRLNISKVISLWVALQQVKSKTPRPVLVTIESKLLNRL